ncbi:hypothetical protein [Natronoglycomyces albus]|uniref:FtsK domain-containing protein n=1 Tax=Natronoglycomyces albus TaxID=2811108 RepID=A0A895XZX4_9ACTN|nr:hypothetical protein [Natronoglycomyces albus]QSB07128.1 hypothetical protein JQS30_16840 [Natronoglycomyces albus]
MAKKPFKKSRNNDGVKRGSALMRGCRYTVSHWRGLLPVLCIGAAMAFSGIAQGFAWAYGPWAWAWIGALSLVLFVWADGWIGELDLSARPPAIGFLLFTAFSVVWLILAGAMIEAYMLVIFGGLGLGTWWWHGEAYQQHRTAQRARRRMESVLCKLGLSEQTRITSVNVGKKGRADAIEWRLYLGDNDRVSHLSAEDIAHLLKVDIARVVVRKVEKGSTRSVKIVQLAASPEKAVDPVHPAVRPENRAEGSEWAPGTRSVVEGLPVGTVLGSAAPSLVKVYSDQKDVKHFMVLGRSGSGKTSSTSGVLLSAIACRDLVIGVCDIPKAGNLAVPFAPALHRVTTTIDQLEADLRGMLALGQDRIRRMNEGKVVGPGGKPLRKWKPSPAAPAVLYLIDELGNTMRDLETDDAERAEVIWNLLVSNAQSLRQAGIILMPISQDAKRESINTTFRKAMSNYMVHQVATPQCVNGIWGGYDLDLFEAGLPKPGMCYVGDTDGAAPTKSIGYDMDQVIEEGEEFDAAVDTYAEARPYLPAPCVRVLGWGDTLHGAQDQQEAHDITIKQAETLNGLNLLADAVDDTAETIPAGIGIIRGTEEPETGDDERLQAVLEALANTQDGLSRADVERVLGVSTATTKRLLGVLQNTEKIVREGKGRATRYRINTAALTAA